MTKILQDRLARLSEIKLRQGSGKGPNANGEIDVCVMQAVDWIAGGDGKTDAPACADRAIARFCIALNDASRFAEWRDELKPFAVRIAGTNQGGAATKTRGYMAADWAVRTIAPMAFDFWAETVPAKADVARELAARLRAVEPITDAKSADAGQAGARTAAAEAARNARVRTPDAAARNAAYAAYAAYAATTAAEAAAFAAAYPTHPAAYAADGHANPAAAFAAENAADAAENAATALPADTAPQEAFVRALWVESLRFLDRMITVTGG